MKSRLRGGWWIGGRKSRLLLRLVGESNAFEGSASAYLLLERFHLLFPRRVDMSIERVPRLDSLCISTINLVSREITISWSAEKKAPTTVSLCPLKVVGVNPSTGSKLHTLAVKSFPVVTKNLESPLQATEVISL